jgi:hypothetical protein
VIVGVLQFIALIVQAYVFWRTLTEVGRQAATLEEHSEHLSGLVRAANANAEAAKTNAEVASNNLEMFIGKERPWLKIELEPLSLQPPSVGPPFILAHYKLRIYGPTEAFILQSSIYGILTDSDKIEDAKATLGGSVVTESVISPTYVPEDRFVLVMKKSDKWDVSPTQEDIGDVDEGKKFIHIWGYVRYKDRFGREHWTKIRYIWTRNFISRNKYSGFWRTSGKPEDNYED